VHVWNELKLKLEIKVDFIDTRGRKAAVLRGVSCSERHFAGRLGWGGGGVAAPEEQRAVS